MTSCPSCGTQRVGAERFCPACGLDYWRAAAATNAPAATMELAPAAAVAVPQGRGVSGILVAVGILLLVGAGAVAAITMMGGGDNAPDLRAGGPAPSYNAEREIVNAFFREARDPDAAFAVAMDSTMNLDAPMEFEVAIVGSGELNGPDWQLEMTVSGVPGQEPLDMQVAFVDGVAYAAIPGVQGWTAADDLGDVPPMNPFAPISTVSEVEYVGRETSGSDTLHHLLVTKWMGNEDLVGIAAQARLTSKENTFHIWVTPDGVPTRVEHEMQFSGELAGETFSVTGEMSYIFSNWGEVAPILAPI